MIAVSAHVMLQTNKHDLPMAHKITVNQTGAFYFSLRKQTNDSYRFISGLMDVSFMAGVHQQPEQSNYLRPGWLKVKPKTCKL